MQRKGAQNSAQSTSDSWFPEAIDAINLTKDWAIKVEKDTKCKVYLFGSSIYKNGEQFNAAQSDLDIVCVFPDGSDASARHDIVVKLKKHKLELEVKMIPALKRDSCVEPGVSIVALTQVELRTNVHKSGVRRFWDKNYFYDFSAKRAAIFHDAGTKYISDEGRHAMEYVQKVRNDYLAIAANNIGGLKPYFGVDPMPKALLRNAAQLSSDTGDGEWYDTMFGLSLLRKRLWDLRSAGKNFLELSNCIEIRSGARGHDKVITPEQQLLLAEVLLDEALQAGIEDAITFQLHVGGIKHSTEAVKDLFAKIRGIVPGVKLTGDRQGSIVLQLQASQSAYKALEKLQEVGALKVLLDADEVTLIKGSFDENNLQSELQSRSEIISNLIKGWVPALPVLNERAAEQELFVFIKNAIDSNPALEGATILANAEVDTMPRFTLDLVISWRNKDDTFERLGIELRRAKGAASVFDILTRFRVLGQKVILVLLEGESLVKKISKDLDAYAKTNANIEVIAVPAEEARRTYQPR